MRALAAASRLGAVLIAGAVATAWAQSGSPRSPAHPPGVMDHVRTLERAVIHGDLDGVRLAATWLADQGSPWMTPKGTEPARDRFTTTATGVARTADLAGAASGTAALVASCGSCHEAASVRPAVPRSTPPAIGGIPGRMTRHQAAADLMIEGLVVPSPDAWRRGATQLREAPPKPGDYPVSDPIGALMAGVATRLRAQAEEAVAANDSASRIRSYATLLATCAECHTKHTTLWPRELR